MSASFRQELAEIKKQEEKEIERILNDPGTSPELKKILSNREQNPSWHRPMLSIEQMMEVEDPELRDKNMPSPENYLDLKEREIGVENILESLKDRERLALEKIFWEGKSQKEIAEETGIPLRTVNWLVNSALKKLQQNPLAKELWDESLYRTYPKGSEKDKGAE